MNTDEPAVLTWMIACAPRPRFSTDGKHWWRDLVTETYRAARDQWLLDAEAASVGYATELAEFRAAHPAPRLSDFMVALSCGAMPPELLPIRLEVHAA